MPAIASKIRTDRIGMTLMEFIFRIVFPPLEMMNTVLYKTYYL